jgi:periplasmic protein CpxP/Spy
MHAPSFPAEGKLAPDEQESDMTEQDTSKATWSRRGVRIAAVALIVLAAGAAGSVATNAFNGGFMPMPGAGMHAHFIGPADPVQIEKRVERMIKHFAVEVDATTEQQDKLTAIAKAAAKDLLPLHEQLHASRKQALDLLTAPTVDRAAIEKLRADKLALADGASKRIAQALADVADVLTPEQRKAVGDRLTSGPFGGFGPHHWRWHRG